MGKRQTKKTSGWSVFGKGLLVSLIIYLAEVLLFTLVLVKGLAVVENVNVMLVVGGAVAAVLGSVVAARTKVVAPLLACVLQTGLFVVALVLAGCLFWDGPIWGKSQLWLMLGVIVAGMLPGAAQGREGRHRKWK